jgi:hypothetical protein
MPDDTRNIIKFEDAARQEKSTSVYMALVATVIDLNADAEAEYCAGDHGGRYWD